VVLVGVDRVGTDDISAELLQVRDVALAVGVVGQRVGVVGVVRGRSICGVLLLVGNTADKELGAIVGVEKFVALE
jgi:hypothetical protein